jgi:hypothetical protein
MVSPPIRSIKPIDRDIKVMAIVSNSSLYGGQRGSQPALANFSRIRECIRTSEKSIIAKDVSKNHSVSLLDSNGAVKNDTKAIVAKMKPRKIASIETNDS